MDRPDTSMEPSTGPAKIVSAGSMGAMATPSVTFPALGEANRTRAWIERMRR